MDAALKRVELLIKRINGIKDFQYPTEADRRDALDLIRDIEGAAFEVPQLEQGGSVQFNALLLLLEKVAGIFAAGLQDLENGSADDPPPIKLEEAAAVAKLACGQHDIITRELKRLHDKAEARFLAKTLQDELEEIDKCHTSY